MTRSRIRTSVLPPLVAHPAPPTTTTAGAEGNTRLTSTTGMVLLVLLAVEGFTVLNVRGMIGLHVFLGTLLVGPVVLKVAATLYRFSRYYLRNLDYVRKGPPPLLLRVLGPFVTLSSLALLGTGLGLLAVRPGEGLLLTAHKASFVIWFAVMTVHVLGHAWEAAINSLRELRQLSRRQLLRLAAVACALVLGVGLAAAVYPAASSWTHRPADAAEHHRH
ncbi:MAG TPA: hypothetical protein VMB79_05440 [Jatrophihabitans sp.]|nr:hypothetical protein [Jatrophihabitans sp.]